MEIRSVTPAAVPVTAKGNAEGRQPAPVAPEAPLPAAAGSPAPVAEAVASVDQETRQRELDESVKKVNDTVHLFNNSVQFSIDEETQRQVIKVVDLETDKVIRQIPSEDILAMARAFDKLQGLLIKDKA